MHKANCNSSSTQNTEYDMIWSSIKHKYHTGPVSWLYRHVNYFHCANAELATSTYNISRLCIRFKLLVHSFLSIMRIWHALLLLVSFSISQITSSLESLFIFCNNLSTDYDFTITGNPLERISKRLPTFLLFKRLENPEDFHPVSQPTIVNIYTSYVWCKGRKTYLSCRSYITRQS